MPAVEGYCAAARACCGEQEAMLDDCELGYAAKNEVVESLQRGAITIGAAELAACVAAYQAAAQSCEANPVIEACAGIARGTIAAGQPCRLGSECAGDGANACLVSDSGSEVGICAPVSRGAVGDPCTFTCRLGEGCDVTVLGADSTAPSVCFESDGVYCDYESPATCLALRATGFACDDDDQCGSQGYCDLSGSSTCKPRGKLNEPCGLCIPSLSCVDGSCRSPTLSAVNSCDGYALGPY
jgi:hypothetical protein